MNKLIKKWGIFLFVSCISISSFAASDKILDEDNTNYYEDEGNLIFKVKAFGIKAHGKEKETYTYGSFVDNGYGVEAATSIFFSPNIAVELSLGGGVLQVNKEHLSKVANENEGSQEVITRKGKRLYMIPLTFLGQYHIAPFGGVSPYIGAGYHGAYMTTPYKAFKIKNGFGAVLQAGVDFYAKDNTLINFDIKQYFLTSKVDYKNPLIKKSSVSSKIKFNPLLISLGVGFKF